MFITKSRYIWRKGNLGIDFKCSIDCRGVNGQCCSSIFKEEYGKSDGRGSESMLSTSPGCTSVQDRTEEILVTKGSYDECILIGRGYISSSITPGDAQVQDRTEEILVTKGSFGCILIGKGYISSSITPGDVHQVQDTSEAFTPHVRVPLVSGEECGKSERRRAFARSARISVIVQDRRTWAT